MNAPTPPTIPGDGGDSLVSFLSVAAPFLVLFALAFWAWPHLAATLAGLRSRVGNTDPQPPPDLVEAPAEEAPVQYRTASLPGGVDASIYDE